MEANKKSELVKFAQIDLLNELKRICDKNEIKYFLIGGTLLGAIRHNGFIPWDDDIDVGMLREEYDKFIDACKSDLSKEYSLYDWNKDPASPLPFLKLKIKGTQYKEDISSNSETNDEIYIDIFPFDNVPQNGIEQAIQSKLVMIIRKILLLKCNFLIDNKTFKKKIGYNFLRIISKMKSKEKWKEKCTQIMKLYNKRDSKFLVNMGGSYSYKREMIERENATTLILHDFEKNKYTIPVKYDEYLKNMYGDYMKLPPESERKSRHGIKCIDLGNYTIHSIEK